VDSLLHSEGDNPYSRSVWPGELQLFSIGPMALHHSRRKAEGEKQVEREVVLEVRATPKELQ
jgi:hypothetical protein